MLAVPAAAWAGAGYEWFLADCETWDCGDRARAWFLFVLVSAPLIPVGAALAGPGARWGALTSLLTVVCMVGAAVFGLIGFALLVAATGVTDAGGHASALYLVVGLFFLTVAGLLVAVRRRLSRRYPSG